MRILTADDEAGARELISVALTRLGYEFDIAEDGRQAWDVLRKRDDIDVAILDWVMPGMDGLELCRKIRALRRTHYTFVILLTIKTGKENYLRGMEAGADDFITKPFDEDSVARLVCGRAHHPAEVRCGPVGTAAADLLLLQEDSRRG